MLFSKTHPWIKKLKQASKEYQDAKLNKKQNIPKGVKIYKDAVQKIEDRIKRKDKLRKNMKLTSRIRGYKL